MNLFFLSKLRDKKISYCIWAAYNDLKRDMGEKNLL